MFVCDTSCAHSVDPLHSIVPSTTPSILQMLSRRTFLLRSSQYNSSFLFGTRDKLCRSLGDVDPGTVSKVEVEVSGQEQERMQRIANRPSLSEILNLHDFEVRH